MNFLLNFCVLNTNHHYYYHKRYIKKCIAHCCCCYHDATLSSLQMQIELLGIDSSNLQFSFHQILLHFLLAHRNFCRCCCRMKSVIHIWFDGVFFSSQLQHTKHCKYFAYFFLLIFIFLYSWWNQEIMTAIYDLRIECLIPLFAVFHS